MLKNLCAYIIVGILFSVLFFPTSAAAQGEGNIWTFGHHNGLDFNQSPPAFIQTSNISLEGSAAISDASGNLIFYTNGNTVWQADGTAMPNGTGLLGNGPGMNIPGSCAQGVTIVKSIAHAQQYYVFVLSAAEEISGPANPGYLRYTVVDMSLNNGNGDVLPDQKNIILDTATSEKMTVTAGVGCSYWLVVHSHNSPEYHAFKIDASGINTIPVVSTGLWQGDYGGGQMKISPDGNWMACVSTLQGTALELANFDKDSGQFSNFMSIAPPSGFAICYGVCFSPDNSKLYLGTWGTITQFDLSLLPDLTAMVAAGYTYPPNLQFSSMRNGPDGKIYVAIYQNTPNIGCINNPNESGAASNFDPYALDQPAYAQITSIPGNPYGHGIGADIVVITGGDTLQHLVRDTAACTETGIMLAASPGFEGYQWDNGSTEMTRTVTESGTYYVYMTEQCSVQIDSFYVQLTHIKADLGPDSTLCAGASILLAPEAASGANYTWQDGSTAATFTVTEAGTYTVAAELNGCISYDTIVISSIIPAVAILQEDTSICLGDVIVLQATANPAGNFQWSNGDTGDQTEVGEAGSYTVTVTNICGSFTDQFQLNTFDCNCNIHIPSAFSPNSDGINDLFTATLACDHTKFHLSIFNRWGQQVFASSQADQGWDGSFGGQPSELGTYFYLLELTNRLGKEEVRKGDLVLIR